MLFASEMRRQLLVCSRSYIANVASKVGLEVWPSSICLKPSAVHIIILSPQTREHPVPWVRVRVEKSLTIKIGARKRRASIRETGVVIKGVIRKRQLEATRMWVIHVVDIHPPIVFRRNTNI
jgi:hypothetical protein